jgi:DNA mismatch endonuclease (patch repair protein)
MKERMKTPSFNGRTPASIASSRAKSRNRSTGARHEKLLCRALWEQGLRYRKNVRTLPGKPDVVFSRARVAVFCDGDFWHGRHWKRLQGHLAEGANATYWIAKIARNRERDQEITTQLKAQGWRVLRLWETDILADPSRAAAQVLHAIR